ncbi:hypothetical protein [Streptomyces sp. ME18-1-4]|uniref:hypothetical protein n=1 Tax=Streptomyces sp. ME18-1-4 TaxID=3028685 RepID=UPI0029AD288F|nr:hypothetical protein [Streptomyces sp. ME18-1-4]MDX3243229.1 hypothetical protein [Streptomyces sp. ME18-1-4]
MYGSELLERITARRAELDELEEQLAKQLAEVRAERDELAVAEKVLERMSEQLAEERASAGPAPGQVGGRALMMIPHRTSGGEETMLPPDYQRILAVVREAAGPVMARQVGKVLGWTSARGPDWSRCAGSWSGWPTAAGFGNCPTAGPPLACDQGLCRPGGTH